MVRRSGVKLAVICVAAAGVIAVPFTVGTAAQEGDARAIVLDTTGFWRLHHTLKPPVVQTDEGLVTVLAVGQRWLHEQTPEPPTDAK